MVLRSTESRSWPTRRADLAWVAPGTSRPTVCRRSRSAVRARGSRRCTESEWRSSATPGAVRAAVHAAWQQLRTGGAGSSMGRGRQRCAAGLATIWETGDYHDADPAQREAPQPGVLTAFPAPDRCRLRCLATPRRQRPERLRQHDHVTSKVTTTAPSVPPARMTWIASGSLSPMPQAAFPRTRTGRTDRSSPPLSRPRRTAGRSWYPASEACPQRKELRRAAWASIPQQTGQGPEGR